MIDGGKHSVLGVMVDAVDYEAATAAIVDAATVGRSFAATALAVHGVMTGVHDLDHRQRLNGLDLVTPDGQPVRWALNGLHGAGIPDRVYGPKLMLRVCGVAAERGLPIYLYGSSESVVGTLRARLQERFPGLVVAGAEPSLFRPTTPEEKTSIAERIVASGARILFVGLGCPRQEIFAYEYRDALPMPILAVGAAFDYHAGLRREPPEFVQRMGLQWLHRLLQEPGRLWKRYAETNTGFVTLLALQRLGIWRPGSRAGERGAPPDVFVG